MVFNNLHNEYLTQVNVSQAQEKSLKDWKEVPKEGKKDSTEQQKNQALQRREKNKSP